MWGALPRAPKAVLGGGLWIDHQSQQAGLVSLLRALTSTPPVAIAGDSRSTGGLPVEEGSPSGMGVCVDSSARAPRHLSAAPRQSVPPNRPLTGRVGPQRRSPRMSRGDHVCSVRVSRGWDPGLRITSCEGAPGGRATHGDRQGKLLETPLGASRWGTGGCPVLGGSWQLLGCPGGLGQRPGSPVAKPQAKHLISVLSERPEHLPVHRMGLVGSCVQSPSCALLPTAPTTPWIQGRGHVHGSPK